MPLLHGVDRAANPRKQADTDTSQVWHVYDLRRENLTAHTDLQDFPRALNQHFVEWLPSDPERPIHWTSRKIWMNLGIISFFRLLTPLASSMIAPATISCYTTFTRTIRLWVASSCRSSCLATLSDPLRWRRYPRFKVDFPSTMSVTFSSPTGTSDVLWHPTCHCSWYSVCSQAWLVVAR